MTEVDYLHEHDACMHPSFGTSKDNHSVVRSRSAAQKVRQAPCTLPHHCEFRFSMIRCTYCARVKLQLHFVNEDFVSLVVVLQDL